MKPIVQENEKGCSVACVAFVCRISYKESLLHFDKGKADYEGYYCKDIIKALHRLGISYKFKYIKKHLRHKIYETNTIVFIKRSRRYLCGYYLVRSKNGWMDPWINHPNNNRKAGFRKRLPGKSIYMIFRS